MFQPELLKSIQGWEGLIRQQRVNHRTPTQADSRGRELLRSSSAKPDHLINVE
jgi:hypothetical protein